MANLKQKIPIQTPVSGVRKDINPLVQTSDMAQRGENCVYFDGVIRPRPALTKEIIDPDEPRRLINDWEYYYNDAGVAVATKPFAFLETSNGYYLLTQGAGGGYEATIYSLTANYGDSWTTPALGNPVTGKVPAYLCEIDGYVIGITQRADFDLDASRALVTGLPSALSWSSIGTVKTGPGSGNVLNSNAEYNHYQVDHGTTSLLISHAASAGFCLSAVNDPGGTPTVQDALIELLDADLPTDYNTVNIFSRGGRCGDFYAFFVSYDMGAPANTFDVHALVLCTLSWDGADYTAGSSFIYHNLYYKKAGQDFDKVNMGSRWYPAGGFDGGKEGENSVFHFAAVGVRTLMVKVVIKPDGRIDSITTQETAERTGTAEGYTTNSYGDFVLLTEADGDLTNDEYRYANLLLSMDSGKTWMQYDRDDDYIDQGAGETNPVYIRDFYLASGENTRSFFAIGVCLYDLAGAPNQDVDSSKVWKLPGSGLGAGGDTSTTMYQTDLKDEDNVVLLGTTKKIFRLDRDTGTWDQITATAAQSNDIDADEVWWKDGEVVPLSAYVNDTQYVDGVTIDGVYGDNPWVFRTFEAQGETFFLGTNGQCYPIVYHPDNTYARRMGELTSQDPNYVSGDYGDLAPKAKCIATAANRVLLANDPTGSPHAVNVSAFNDMDRGWDEEQFVLLSDTPGEIVSMNEINALQVAVYKEDAIYHAVAQTEFLGVSAPFRFELSKAGISGPCSPNAVLRNFDGRQIYLARDGGVYMYDGVAPIDGGRNIRRLIQSDIDLNALGKCWGVVDNLRKLVWFFYPSTSQLVNRGIVISTDQGYPWPAWPVRTPDGWDFTSGLQARLTDDASIGELSELDKYSDDIVLTSFASGRSEMLMCMRDKTTFSQKWGETDQRYNDDGIPIPIHLQTGWTTPGLLEVWTADTLHHIFSCTDPEQELQVRIRAQQLGRNIKTSSWSPLYSGKRQRRTHHRIGGVQFAMEMMGDVNRLFSWGGAVMTGKRRGGRR